MKNILNNILKQIKILHQDFLDTIPLFKDNKIKHIPNILTIIRLLLVPVVAILFITNNLIALFITSTIASSTDYLDGTISRRLKAYNEFGKKLDPVADKCLAGALLIINAIALPIFMATIILEIIISKINMQALNENKNTQTNQDGRMKTAVLYGTLLVGLLNTIIPSLIPITIIGFTATTLLQTKTINSYLNDYYVKYDHKKSKKEEVKHLNKDKKKTLI